MSAEDEFPLMTKTEFVIQPEEWRRMCFEIDRLRAEVQRADVIYPPASIETVSAWSAMQPLEAIRQTVNCPSCGGTAQQARPAGWDQRAHLDDPNRTCDCHDSWDQCPCAEGGHVAGCNCCPGGTGLCGPLPCRDCTDGKIDMARLIAVGAAVFLAVLTYDEINVNVPNRSTVFSAAELLRTLRQVRP